MKKYLIHAMTTALMSILLITSTVSAQSNQLTDLVYYEIGGGKAFSGPPSYIETLNINAAADLKLGYSCGAFDLEESITSMFDNLKDSADKAINVLAYAVEAGISSIPLYLLRRADPNLASMLENMLLRYEEVFNIGVKNCKIAEREILAGKNPYYDWVSWGVANKWKEKAEEKAGGAEVPIQDAQEAVDTETGCVVWIEGEKRMCDDAAIKSITVVEDIVTHGYEQIVDLGGGGTELGTDDHRLGTIWPTAEAAVEAIQLLVGEYEFTDMRTTEPASLAPVGALPGMFLDAKVIKENIVAATTKGAVVSDAEIDGMSVPGLAVNQTLIDALKNLPPGIRDAATNRIATELALINATEQVNLARRLIIVGSSDPNVAASPARNVINDEILPRLEAESRLLKDEFDLRDRIAKSTAFTLITNDIQRAHRRTQSSGGRSVTPIQGGAVNP